MARQAFAGLLWGKQFFHYDVKRWLAGDPGQPPPPPGRGTIRNGDWPHLNNHEVILMPDPWEYPWFAAWDLAFHCVTLAHIDPAFAKSQLVLLLREWYMHPNGQIPAYEWNFSDVNPPVHAWAALRVFELDGGTDFTFLARIFHKLLINFTWWVDNKDHGGQQPVPGRLHGAGQHRPAGPVDPAAVGGIPGAGRLHRLDGDVRPGPAGHGAAAGHAQHARTRTWRRSSSSTSWPSPAPPTTPGLWDEQDSYFYDVLHLADGDRHPDQGEIPGRPGADERGAGL